MRRFQTVLFSLIAAAFLAPGCGGDDGEPLGHKLEELETEVGILDAMASDHDTVIQAAADLGAMSTEELGYGTNAGAQGEALHHMIQEFAECDHEGSPPSTFDLAATLEEAEDELVAHSAAMSAAADTTTALAEEARHQAAMDDLIGSMMADHESMAASAGDFTCPGHHDQ